MKYAVIFGAQSWEHEISIVSAVVMKKVLNAELCFIFISPEREFYEITPSDMKAVYFATGKYKKAKRLMITTGGFGKHTLTGFKKLDVDCYINLVHGMDGEDGKLAGILEFYGINFIGPRLEASVMSFNKVLTKKLCELCAVPSLPYEVLKRGDKLGLSLPAILKPARLGSSIGVQIVREPSELEYACDVGFEFDDTLLAEPFIEGIREFNLAGFKAEGEFHFSMIEEPKKTAFLDFEQKYLSFSGESGKRSADIDASTQSELKDAFRRIYETGGFDGALIRCDFFYHEGKVYLNEINPNPGSLANYLFADFTAEIECLAKHLPKPKQIKVEYNFINEINGQKGKMG